MLVNKIKNPICKGKWYMLVYDNSNCLIKVNSIYNLCKYEKYEDGRHLLEHLALLAGGEAAGHPPQQNPAENKSTKNSGHYLYG
jgi:hypothetical protein